jgi:hypothetical protein
VGVKQSKCGRFWRGTRRLVRRLPVLPFKLAPTRDVYVVATPGLVLSPPSPLFLSKLRAKKHEQLGHLSSSAQLVPNQSAARALSAFPDSCPAHLRSFILAKSSPPSQSPDIVPGSGQAIPSAIPTTQEPSKRLPVAFKRRDHPFGQHLLHSSPSPKACLSTASPKPSLHSKPPNPGWLSLSLFSRLQRGFPPTTDISPPPRIPSHSTSCSHLLRYSPVRVQVRREERSILGRHRLVAAVFSFLFLFFGCCTSHRAPHRLILAPPELGATSTPPAGSPRPITAPSRPNTERRRDPSQTQPRWRARWYYTNWWCSETVV